MASGADRSPSRTRGRQPEDVRDTPYRRVERLMIVRPEDNADREAAGDELEGLPGVVAATLDHVTSAFDVIFDAEIVSDDELAASLHHYGYEVVSWQEAREMHASLQRTWLLDQIGSLVPRAELELAERGTYAEGATKGAVDAYIRVARAFGLVTDAEIRRLIPARFLEGTLTTDE